MVKPLPGLGLWLWSRLLTLLAHLHATLLWLLNALTSRLGVTDRTSHTDITYEDHGGVARSI